MVQEHWLTTDNLFTLNSLSDDYFVFGSSAMNECINTGPLVGRPFGGTAFIISKKCISVTHCLVTQDRYTAIKLANWLFITVYFPCVGTVNRDLLYCDLLAEVDSLIAAHASCDVLLAGEINTDLQINSSASSAVKNFISRNKLYQCNILFPSACKSTYGNDSTHASSTIDYMLTSNADSVVAFNILDID